MKSNQKSVKRTQCLSLSSWNKLRPNKPKKRRKRRKKSLKRRNMKRKLQRKLQKRKLNWKRQKRKRPKKKRTPLVILSMKRLICLQLRKRQKTCRMKFQRQNPIKAQKPLKMQTMTAKRKTKRKKSQNLKQLSILKMLMKPWTISEKDQLSINYKRMEEDLQKMRKSQNQKRRKQRKWQKNLKKMQISMMMS